MSGTIMFILPWPPSLNHYWGINTKAGTYYITKKGKAFRAQTKFICWGVLKNKEPYTERLSVRVDAYPPDKRKRDLDNVLKAPLDAMEDAGVYNNDSQIDEIHIVRKAECPALRC